MTILTTCRQRMQNYRLRRAHVGPAITLLVAILFLVGPTQPVTAQTAQEQIRLSEYQLSWQENSQALNRAYDLRTDFTPGGLTVILRTCGGAACDANPGLFTNPALHSPVAYHDGIVTPDATVLVSGGEFPMGADQNHNGGYAPDADETPLHTVYLDAYVIDQTEVTNNAYVAFLNARGSNNCEGAECIDLDDPNARIMVQSGQYLVQGSYGNHPVTEVTWYGAHAYCGENGMRLPTEAEWEKAARGVTVRAFPWGDSLPNCTLANSRNDDAPIRKFCVGDTKAVGSYLNGVSPYGALDMAGNIWEWTNDWYSETYYSNSPHANPQGPALGSWKVIRGGSWDYPWHGLLTANRYRALPLHSGNSIGFRCVAALSQ